MQITNVPEKEVESYQNEVRLLTELEHPGIVSHIESFIDGDKQHMCIVMNYCEGGDLAAYLKHKKNTPLREGEVLYHFVQMALSLMYMHDKNILHRYVREEEGAVSLRDALRARSSISYIVASTC
jgi:NIMA (never in mitosis gene a)-related kinase